MVTGLVLIKLSTGKETRAVENIKVIPGVKGVTGTFGSWDALAFVQANDLESLASMIISKIRAVEGVKNTETLIEVKI